MELFVPFELGLLFSFQRPTRQIPEKVGVGTTLDYPADQGAQSLEKLASESIFFSRFFRARFETPSDR